VHSHGYGFIARAFGPSLYFHLAELVDGHRFQPDAGDHVEFQTAGGSDGRSKAVRVRCVEYVTTGGGKGGGNNMHRQPMQPPASAPLHERQAFARAENQRTIVNGSGGNASRASRLPFDDAMKARDAAVAATAAAGDVARGGGRGGGRKALRLGFVRSLAAKHGFVILYPERGHGHVNNGGGVAQRPYLFVKRDVRAQRPLRVGDAVAFTVCRDELPDGRAVDVVLLEEASGFSALNGANVGGAVGDASVYAGCQFRRAHPPRISCDDDDDGSGKNKYNNNNNSNKNHQNNGGGRGNGRAPDPFYFVGEDVPAEENRACEFKSCARSKAITFRLEEHADRYLNGFLNTEGGTLFIGVEDDSRVSGIALSKAECVVRVLVSCCVYLLFFLSFLCPSARDTALALFCAQFYFSAAAKPSTQYLRLLCDLRFFTAAIKFV
jgi:hypothetical protein